MTPVIAVRGAGIVSALGVGAAAVCARVASDAGASGYCADSAGAAYPAPFDAARDLPRGLGRRLGRQPAMALAAVLESVAHAGLSADDLASAALVLGTAHGPVAETVAFLNTAFRDGGRYASPALFSNSLHNAMSGSAGRELGARGPAFVVCNGETSFETALVTAIALLRTGRARFAVVGCSEAHESTSNRLLTDIGYCAARREPIDPAMLRTTRGIVPGEGAAALVLEAVDGHTAGVRIAHAALGDDAVEQGFAAAGPVPEVLSLATGDVRSAARHRAVVSGSAPVSFPAARFGAFAGLGAAATALDVARRMEAPPGASTEASGSTVTVNVPAGAPPACVVISGTGRG